MKKEFISFVLCFAVVFLNGNLSAQTQTELYEQVKSLAEIKDYIRSASFEDATPWQQVTPNWENTGFQGQDNDAFPEMTGSKYCEKWVADGNNIADAHLYQTCTLPNGQYVISVDAKATQQDQGGIEGFYLVARDGSWDPTNLTRVPITGPLNFTVEENGTTQTIISYYIPITITSGSLSVGILSENATANYVRFDNFRLFTPDAIPVLKEDISKKLNQLDAMLDEIPGGYKSLLYNGENPLYESAIDLTDNSTDEAELTKMSDSISAVIRKAELGKTLFGTLLKGVDQSSSLASNTDYSGKTAFQAAIENAIILVNDNSAFNKEIEDGIAELKLAIKTYKTTQVDNASENNPVDLTFLIDTPNFSTIPDFGIDDITDQSTASKGAWLTSNVYSGTSKDDRLNYCSSKNCWNNWSNTFYSLDLYQTLRNMPEGTYSVKLLASTGGELGNARGYARSTNGVVYSPIHTISTTENPFATNALWEELITGKIYVTENDTLRIGISSTNTEGNNTNGWFCATEFKLLYYGKGNANKQILEMKLAEIETLDVEGSMTEKALSDLRTVIDKALDLYDNEIFSGEVYDAVLAEIDSIIPLTETRVSVYAEFKKKDNEISDFVNRGESEICDLISAVQEEYAEKIEENADIDSDEFEQYTKELDRYLTFANTFMSYEIYATRQDDFDQTDLTQYVKELYSVLDFVGENGLSSLTQAENQLRQALEALLYKTYDEGDLTKLISNPSFEENTGGSPAGWTNKGFNVADNKNFKLNGNAAYTGENFCEQWVNGGNHGHLGDIQIYQTAYVPNGYYTVTVDAMAFQQADLVDIVGFYLVGKNGNWNNGSDLIKEPILYPYKEITAEEDTIITYSIDLMVTTNKLTFGMITEGTNANWVMCDNFRITFNEKFFVGVEDIYNGDTEEILIYTEGRRIIAPENAVIYTLNGLEIANPGELQPGVYLVRIGNRTYKTFVK